MDRRRKKLPEKPSRSEIFGRAGLRWTKMKWLRIQPDLRQSVIVALATALQMKPWEYLREILAEEQRSRADAKKRRASLTRSIAG